MDSWITDRADTEKIHVNFWYIKGNIVSIFNAVDMLCCVKTRPEQGYVESIEKILVLFGHTEAGWLELLLTHWIKPDWHQQ